MRILVPIAVLAIVVALVVPVTSAGKGLAVAPATNTISPAVDTTKAINQYFKNALGSSTMLITKKATRRALMNQLKYNRKLIAWNFIGEGDSTKLIMYDGALTSSDFNGMNRWRGLKDCVCFVGSDNSYSDALRNSIVNGSASERHGVRTYVGCTVANSISTHAEISTDFWQHTLFECYNMSDALEAAVNSHNATGYSIWGDTGRFFPPPNIHIIVSPKSCVVKQWQPMTIIAKSDRYLFPGTEVKLEVYKAENASTYDRWPVLERSWTISKKTKLLFKYTWYQSLLPRKYKIKVSVPKCGGTSYRYFVIVPQTGKLELDSIPARELYSNRTTTASLWFKPTRVVTYEKYGEYQWLNITLGSYYVTIPLTDDRGKKVRYIYQGRGVLSSYNKEFTWNLRGSSSTNFIYASAREYNPGPTILSATILDAQSAKIWQLRYSSNK